MKKLLYIIAVLLAFEFLAASELPDYRGPVNDRAGVLNRDQIEQLDAKILAYRKLTGNEIGVLIIPTIGNRSLEDYAHDVLRAWEIGKKDKDNGVLFLAAIQERKARIEVGYGLEGTLTDLECGRLVNRNSPMAQNFRNDDYAAGIGAVLDGIVEAIGGDYDPPEPKNGGEDILSLIFPFVFFVMFIIIAIFRRKGIISRTFGGPFSGGFGGGSFGGGSSGGGGGFSFGGGSSGGGGASGGW
nr:TPM domain-containing protein [candidate division Zixibacteria bacterium]